MMAPATRIILAFLAAVLLTEATGASYGVELGGYLIGASHMHAAHMAERGQG